MFLILDLDGERIPAMEWVASADTVEDAIQVANDHLEQANDPEVTVVVVPAIYARQLTHPAR